jgi:DnaJ-domain-containing protein 1
MEDIRRAYRRRMSEYHPDKVAHLGEEIRQVATEKSKEINAAYEEASRQCQGR